MGLWKKLVGDQHVFFQKKLFNDISLKTFISLYANKCKPLISANLDTLAQNVRKRVSGTKVNPVLDAKW